MESLPDGGDGGPSSSSDSVSVAVPVPIFVQVGQDDEYGIRLVEVQVDEGVAERATNDP